MKQMNDVTASTIDRLVDRLEKIHNVSIYDEQLNRLYMTDEYVDVMNRSRKIIDTLALMMNNSIKVEFPAESEAKAIFKKDFDDDSHGCGTIVYNYIFKNKYPCKEELHLEISENGSRYTQSIGYERCGKLDGIPLTKTDYKKIIVLVKSYIQDFDHIEKVFWNTIQDFLDEIESK